MRTLAILVCFAALISGCRCNNYPAERLRLKERIISEKYKEFQACLRKEMQEYLTQQKECQLRFNHAIQERLKGNTNDYHDDCHDQLEKNRKQADDICSQILEELKKAASS